MRKEFEKNEEKTRTSLEEKIRLQDETEGDLFQKVLDKDFVEREKEIVEEIFADKEFEDYVPTKEKVRSSYQELLRRYEKQQRERMHEEKREEFSEEFSGELVPDEKLIREIGKKKDTTAGSTGNESRTEKLRERQVISLEDARKRRKKTAERKTESAGYRENADGERRTGSGRRYRLGKVVGMAIVCVACVFAASMTSEANRKYLVNSVRIWSGDDTKTTVDNDEENDKANKSEEEAIADIEEHLGINVPTFYYRPYGMEFLNYSIKNLSSLARIEYQYKDQKILLIMDKENVKTASKINSLDGNEEGRIKLDVEGITIEVKKVYNQDGKYNSSVEWHKDGTVYLLFGGLDIEEAKKIAENIKF